MSKYHEVVYGNYVRTEFPQSLIEYLLDNHWPQTSKHESYRHSVVSSMSQDVSVLDVGCGDCTYLEKGFWAFHHADGIDCDRRYVRAMGFKEPGKMYRDVLPYSINFNTDKLPYADNSFDIVFTKSVIEHIANTEHFLSELKRVLKPGGKIIVLTPAWEYNYKDFYNDYTHVKPFHRKGLQDALKINGFSNVNVEYHYHLPWLWKKPALFPLVLFLRIFSRWKWKNREENIHRVNIRFSQEVQLLGVAIK